MMLRLLTFIAILSAAWSYQDKVKLKDIDVVTLRDGYMTKGRRSSPIPQLQCQGGSAGCRFQPKIVQCYNKGHDGVDQQWECKAEMNKKYRFGWIEVSCEGYDYPTDPYILAGSCGLRYNIDRTDTGGYPRQGGYQDEGINGFTCMIIIIGVIMMIQLCRALQSTPPQGDNSDYPDDHHRFRRGGGHNWGSPQPPPYGFKPEYTQQPPTYEQSTTNHQASSSSRSEGGGFWTGMGLGALGGYLAGSSNRPRSHHYQRRYDRQMFGGGSSYHSDEDSWGSSGETRTSSGYGGTSRR